MGNSDRDHDKDGEHHEDHVVGVCEHLPHNGRMEHSQMAKCVGCGVKVVWYEGSADCDDSLPEFNHESPEDIKAAIGGKTPMKYSTELMQGDECEDNVPGGFDIPGLGEHKSHRVTYLGSAKCTC